MQATINNIYTPVTEAKKVNKITLTVTTQKILLFVSILACLVTAVNI